MFFVLNGWSYCEVVFTTLHAGKTNTVSYRTAPSSAAWARQPHRVSLGTGVMKIEDSDRIYNIEFKIWGVKKKKT